MRARWIDLGQVSPVDLYAACQGLAQAQQTHDFTPMVLWGRSDRPHVSLGASQWAEAELDLEACRSLGVEVVRRCLGGGTVLVDPDQWCFFFVLPRVRTPASRDRLFESCLAPVAATFRELGLAVQRVGRGDLWLDGKKVLGSGAATLSKADVLGASFLLRFQPRLFARLVRSPSAEFRVWLEEALAQGMTDWAQHGRLPDEIELRACFQRHIGACLGWTLREDQLAPRERDMIVQARVELTEPLETGGRRLVENGIKINHRTYLIEHRDAQGGVRMLVRDGVIARLGVEPVQPQVISACIGVAPRVDRLEPALARILDGRSARMWAEWLDLAAAGLRRVQDG